MKFSQNFNYVVFTGFTIIFFYLLIFMPKLRTLTTAEILMLVMGLGVVMVANMIQIDKNKKKVKKK